MTRRKTESVSTKNDEFNDLGFPREIAYDENNTSESSEWKKELNEELRIFLEEHPELRKLPMRADSYIIIKRIVRRRKKYFAVLTYLGNGPAGPTNNGCSTNGEGVNDGHIMKLGDLPAEGRSNDYGDFRTLDSD